MRSQVLASWGTLLCNSGWEILFETGKANEEKGFSHSVERHCSGNTSGYPVVVPELESWAVLTSCVTWALHNKWGWYWCNTWKVLVRGKSWIIVSLHHLCFIKGIKCHHSCESTCQLQCPGKDTFSLVFLKVSRLNTLSCLWRSCEFGPKSGFLWKADQNLPCLLKHSVLLKGIGHCFIQLTNEHVNLKMTHFLPTVHRRAKQVNDKDGKGGPMVMLWVWLLPWEVTFPQKGLFSQILGDTWNIEEWAFQACVQ